MHTTIVCADSSVCLCLFRSHLEGAYPGLLIDTAWKLVDEVECIPLSSGPLDALQTAKALLAVDVLANAAGKTQRTAVFCGQRRAGVVLFPCWFLLGSHMVFSY